MGDDRPSVYTEGDLTVYRASALGNCIQGLVAARQGITPNDHPDWLLKRFEEGHQLEPVLLWRFTNRAVPGVGTFKMLDPTDAESYSGSGYTYVKQGYVHERQFTAQIPVGDKAVIRGHLDGIGQLYMRLDGSPFELRQRVVVEAKALGPDYWDKYVKLGIEAFPYYAMQVSIYSYATRLPVAFVVGRKEEKKGRDPVPGIAEHRVDWFHKPPVSMGAIKARVAKIEKLAAKGLPDCDVRQYPCQFFYLTGCGKDEVKPAKESVEIDDAELGLAASVYLRGTEMEREGKRLKEGVKGKIKELVADHANKVVKADGYAVEWVEEEVPEQTRTIKAYTKSYPKITKSKEK